MYKEEIKHSGAPATICELVYYKPVLIKLLKKYPSLILDLHKSDTIISLLSDEFNKVEKFIFQEWLTVSLGFFELCLMNDPATIINQGKTIFLFTDGIKLLDANKRMNTSISPPVELVLFSTMQHCILNDILKNKATPEAIDYLEKCKIIDFEFERRLGDERLLDGKAPIWEMAKSIFNEFGGGLSLMTQRARGFKWVTDLKN